MPHFAKYISEIAQSQKSRDTLNHWPVFKLPGPDEKIEALMKQLSEKDAMASDAESEEDPFGLKAPGPRY